MRPQTRLNTTPSHRQRDLAVSSTISPTPTDDDTMAARSPKSLMITLRLAPKDLAKFPSDPAPQTDARSKSLSSATPISTPAEQTADPPVSQNASDAQPAPSTNGTTPMAIDSNNPPAAPTQNGGRRKGIPGPKPGSKRGAALTADGMPKPRGKPGPKKKPRL